MNSVANIITCRHPLYSVCLMACYMVQYLHNAFYAHCAGGGGCVMIARSSSGIDCSHDSLMRQSRIDSCLEVVVATVETTKSLSLEEFSFCDKETRALFRKEACFILSARQVSSSRYVHKAEEVFLQPNKTIFVFFLLLGFLSNLPLYVEWGCCRGGGWFRTHAGVLLDDNDLTTCGAGASSHVEGATARTPIKSAYERRLCSRPPPFSVRIVYTVRKYINIQLVVYSCRLMWVRKLLIACEHYHWTERAERLEC